jgi:hypothetical protein
MGAVALVAAVLAVLVGSAGATGESRHPAVPGARCTAAEVRKVVVSYLAAFNAGRRSKLNSIFTRPALFKWYSVSGPEGRLAASAYDRSTLMSYFASRHRQGERLTLRSFRFNGSSSGYGSFEYALMRTARDLETANYVGKGALLCVRPRSIAVWSMAQE